MDPIKILIVDDMSVITELIASVLLEQNPNYKLITANNGRTACKLAVTEEPNLIIMDWEMPEMSGLEALTRLKKNESTKEIPVIISSGFTQAENVQKALEAGAVDYIRKPIENIELTARVQSVLALSNAFIKIREKNCLLAIERQRTESLLRGYLPEQLAEEILNQGFSKPKRYKNVSVMFADLVNFTTKTNAMSPKRMFDELNEIFPAFNSIMKDHNCTKIKTIGDAYMAACGLPEEDSGHATKMVRAATEMIKFLLSRNKVHHTQWEIRIGIHSGDVYGGLLGKDYYHFDVFGDTINTSARMQQYSEPMKINVSAETNILLKNYYKTTEREPVTVKGKGVQKMYFVEL
jgi:class 3 adenylate cyclase/CheY-like chemotaxis protein